MLQYSKWKPEVIECDFCLRDYIWVVESENKRDEIVLKLGWGALVRGGLREKERDWLSKMLDGENGVGNGAER